MLNAEFTMCYKDVIEQYPDVLENIVMDTTEHTSKLRDMLAAKWSIYEISGETIPEFKLFLECKFNQYKDYYVEMLGAYETEINWINGLITSTNLSEAGTDNKDYTPGAVYETETSPGVSITDENYDLPRSASSENRPSSKTVSTPSGSDVRTVTPTGGTDNTLSTVSRNVITSMTRADQIEQRDKYLKSIRSLYAEFADKFKPCFLDIYL